jgi:hypothetical protein
MLVDALPTFLLSTGAAVTKTPVAGFVELTVNVYVTTGGTTGVLVAGAEPLQPARTPSSVPDKQANIRRDPIDIDIMATTVLFSRYS